MKTERERVRGDLERIYRAAVAAVDPAKLTARAIEGAIADAAGIPALIDEASRVYVLGVGKASSAMASVLVSRLGDKLEAATIVTLPGGGQKFASNPRIVIRESSHPILSQASENAANAALRMLSRARRDDLVIVALSGGTSAMFAKPPDGIPLADKIALTQSILRTGASIREFNTVRKHLSSIKGGQLINAVNGARVLSLILSDVPDNDLATIGSGLTAPDPTTYAEAIGVLKRRLLWGRAPESIRSHLERGNAGEIAETPKSGDAIFSRVTNVIVGDNQTALEAAESAAREIGYSVARGRELRGEANDLGCALATDLAAPSQERKCIIAGGEPVVTVRGSGKGGRAQQCALSMVLELSRVPNDRQIAALVAGTDGIDGPTEAAGAFAFLDTARRARDLGMDPANWLNKSDAYTFFRQLGDIFMPGATGTNVADIFIGLINY